MRVTVTSGQARRRNENQAARVLLPRNEEDMISIRIAAYVIFATTMTLGTAAGYAYLISSS